MNDTPDAAYIQGLLQKVRPLTQATLDAYLEDELAQRAKNIKLAQATFDVIRSRDESYRSVLSVLEKEKATLSKIPIASNLVAFLEELIETHQKSEPWRTYVENVKPVRGKRQDERGYGNRKAAIRIHAALVESGSDRIWFDGAILMCCFGLYQNMPMQATNVDPAVANFYYQVKKSKDSEFGF